MGAPELVGHWPLAGDLADHSPSGLPARGVGVELGAPGPGGRPGAAARFDGCGARLDVADRPPLHFGTGDVSLAAWMHTDAAEGDVIGSILSKFDPQRRKGLHFYGLTHSGMTTTAQSNYRHLHFGIDDGRADAGWTDHGRPGNAVFVPALLASGDLLYASTLELGAGEAGGLWRHDGGQRWVSLGNPAGSSVIQSVAEFDGALYCGTGRYIGAGSALPEPKNQRPGGTVWRLDPAAPEAGWAYCGHPGAEGATPEDRPVSGFSTGKADDAVALTVYRGALYCASNHRPGVFRYAGGQAWEPVGLADQRIMTLTVYRRRLYALLNGGPVFRYESGREWASCGAPERSTQTYAAVAYEGRLHVGTWPEGELFRYDGDEAWTRIGRVGYEREVMGLAHYNGKMYLGTLPMANVFRLDGDRFTLTGTLDQSPAPLRRVWSLAVFQGRLYAGTLPSGHVLSLEAGKMATWDQTLPGGWRHVAAVKEGGRLKLYVDGAAVAWSAPFHPGDYDLTTDQPLRIGFGAYDSFDGLLSDVRVYRGALSPHDVAELARA